MTNFDNKKYILHQSFELIEWWLLEKNWNRIMQCFTQIHKNQERQLLQPQPYYAQLSKAYWLLSLIILMLSKTVIFNPYHLQTLHSKEDLLGKYWVVDLQSQKRWINCWLIMVSSHFLLTKYQFLNKL